MAVNPKFNDKKTIPVYQKLSKLNSELGNMKEEEIRKKLRELKLSDKSVLTLTTFLRYPLFLVSYLSKQKAKMLYINC